MDPTRAPAAMLQRRAEAKLPATAPELAAEALATGRLFKRTEESAWHGSLGRVRGVHVVLVVAPPLHEALVASPSSVDELTRAVAAAVSENAGEMLADLAVEAGEPGGSAHDSGPYRSA